MIDVCCEGPARKQLLDQYGINIRGRLQAYVGSRMAGVSPIALRLRNAAYELVRSRFLAFHAELRSIRLAQADRLPDCIWVGRNSSSPITSLVRGVSREFLPRFPPVVSRTFSLSASRIDAAITGSYQTIGGAPSPFTASGWHLRRWSMPAFPTQLRVQPRDIAAQEFNDAL